MYVSFFGHPVYILVKVEAKSAERRASEGAIHYNLINKEQLCQATTLITTLLTSPA